MDWKTTDDPEYELLEYKNLSVLVSKDGDWEIWCSGCRNRISFGKFLTQEIAKTQLKKRVLAGVYTNCGELE